MENFLRFPGFKTRAVTLSYDDGTCFDRQMVQVLNRWGLKCTFNLNSGRFGTDRVLPADELPALYQGHEVAVHTLTHPHLENLTPGQIAYQVSRDRKNLETLFGCLVEGMAYPFGLNDTPGQVETLAACGIRYSRTTLPEDVRTAIAAALAQ